MQLFVLQIAEHQVHITTESESAERWIRDMFQVEPQACASDGQEEGGADLAIHVTADYGTSFVDYQVDITHGPNQVVYRRADYQMTCSDLYAHTDLAIHDYLALKHALITLYSAYLADRQWGLVIHSSCVVDAARGYVFAGHSGQGKSTVARLSQPRPIFSDEASLVKIDSDGIYVFDSPFRTALMSQFSATPMPLKGIYLLRQSHNIQRNTLPLATAMTGLMERTFYWAHDNAETTKVVKMQKYLLQHVPIYELEFQKNDLFWEVVS